MNVRRLKRLAFALAVATSIPAIAQKQPETPNPAPTTPVPAAPQPTPANSPANGTGTPTVTLPTTLPGTPQTSPAIPNPRAFNTIIKGAERLDGFFALYRKDNPVAGGCYNAAADAWSVPCIK